jgi:hypothetical protein
MPFKLRQQPIPEVCVTDFIQSQVGESDILFQDGRMPAPFRIAVTEHQLVIA